MELEFKHVAAYLPHNVLVAYNNNSHHRIELFGVLQGENGIQFKGYLMDFKYIANYKLALRPMNQLTRKELQQAGFRTHIDFLTHELQSPTCTHKIEDAPHKMVEYLLSQHYDIFGLLDAGLAVEK